LQGSRRHIFANNGNRFKGVLHVEIKSQLRILTKQNYNAFRLNNPKKIKLV